MSTIRSGGLLETNEGVGKVGKWTRKRYTTNTRSSDSNETMEGV